MTDIIYPENIVYSTIRITGTATETFDPVTMKKTTEVVHGEAEVYKDRNLDRGLIWKIVNDETVESQLTHNSDLQIEYIENSLVLSSNEDESVTIFNHFTNIAEMQKMMMDLNDFSLKNTEDPYTHDDHRKKVFNHLHEMQMLEFKELNKYIRPIDHEKIDDHKIQYLLFSSFNRQYIIRHDKFRHKKNSLEDYLQALSIDTRYTR